MAAEAPAAHWFLTRRTFSDFAGTISGISTTDTRRIGQRVSWLPDPRWSPHCNRRRCAAVGTQFGSGSETAAISDVY
jgi:hypothetical protein